MTNTTPQIVQITALIDNGRVICVKNPATGEWANLIGGAMPAFPTPFDGASAVAPGAVLAAPVASSVPTPPDSSSDGVGEAADESSPLQRRIPDPSSDETFTLQKRQGRGWTDIKQYKTMEAAADAWQETKNPAAHRVIDGVGNVVAD